MNPVTWNKRKERQQIRTSLLAVNTHTTGDHYGLYRNFHDALTLIVLP